MEKSTVFIASSGRTLTLAELLRDELENEFCEPVLWKEESRAGIGASIIDMLEKAAASYDFAVVILAKDDVLVSGTDEKLQARDNCIFEAGMFISSLGRQRCFLLNSVPNNDLPSDLAGVLSQPFEEPDDLADRAACRKAMRSVAGILKDKIQKLGKRSGRSLSEHDLLKREKLRVHDRDGELYEDQVVVHTVQPLEMDYEAAVQARANMLDGGVQYVYVLSGTDDGANKVCRLLQMVLLSKWLEGDTAYSFARRESKLEEAEVQRAIVEDLATMSKRGGLKVFFLAVRPILQYCIHNATSSTGAVLYLKHGKSFVKWEDGEKAHDFWEQERAKSRILFDSPSVMFHKSGDFPPTKSERFDIALKNAIRKYFPPIHEDVYRLCVHGG